MDASISKRVNRSNLPIKAALLMFSALASLASFAQDIPDTFFDMPVNPRTDAMGGIVSVLNYDASATVNNPASLALVGSRQFFISARSQPKIETLLLAGGGTSRGVKAGSIGLGLVGIAFPIGGRQGGTLSVSYARTGHYQEHIFGSVPVAGTGVTNITDENRKIDTDFITIAYGSHLGRNRGMNFGVGAVIAQQRFNFDNNDYFDDGSSTLTPVDVSSRSATGTGVGILVGVLNAAPKSSIGASYRSEIRLSGQGDLQFFSKNVPARFTVGGAVLLNRSGDPTSGSGADLIGAADIIHYFKSNRGLQFETKDVTDFRLGLEYALYFGKYSVPLRVGYQNNQTTSDLFTSTNAFTAGIGFRPNNQRFGVDLSFGFGSGAGTTAVVGFNYRLDK